MVGDGTELRTAEAAELLNVSESAVVKWQRKGLLRAKRTAGGHRRIERASVEELIPILMIEDNAERRAALDFLARRNRGEVNETPAG